MPAPAQLGLLTWEPPRVAPGASPQSVELARVEGRHAKFIMSWLALRVAEAPLFRLSELEADCAANVATTPGSAGRILRLMRQAGQVDYRVERRSESLYRALWVRP